MNADGPWPDDLWERMIRAVKSVEERLHRSAAALDRAQVPYAVIGAHAVAYWVAQRDEGAQRNTPNVDILIPHEECARAQAALEEADLVSVKCTRPSSVALDKLEGRPRDAVRLWLIGVILTVGTEPLPDVADAVRTPRFRVISLPALVRMKLSAWRTIDKVHLQDLIGVGLLDATWPEKFPDVLAERLREILADPDG